MKKNTLINITGFSATSTAKQFLRKRENKTK
jgi:hypothetical protein